MALNFDDSRAIDARKLSAGRYVFRYYDGQDQRVVALEFDEEFRSLSEVRARFPESNGEESHAQYCGH
jgi:NAD-dependent DNA ligase